MFARFYNREAQLERYIKSDNRYNEAEYESAITIKVCRYGPKGYKRDNDNESVYAEYIYQTTADVKVKDRLDGYIVTKVNEHYDIFGNFVYREVYVVNG